MTLLTTVEYKLPHKLSTEILHADLGRPRYPLTDFANNETTLLNPATEQHIMRDVHAQP